MVEVLADVLQVGDTRRPTLRIKPYDANTTPTLTIVMPDGSASPLSLTGPVLQGDGAGLWTASASYTLSLPGRWHERFLVTNPVTGIGAGAESMAIDVEGTPPPAATGTTAAWATVAQYMAQIGGTPPANLPYLLRVATLTLRPHIAVSWYDSTDATVVAAKAEACCLQVAYAVGNGWTSGAPALVQAGKIGSVEIKAGVRSDGGAGALAPISPLAAEVLESAGLLVPGIGNGDAWPWWWL